METRKSKRSLRLALVMGAAVAGTALVGWGGLAAWQAYTQNAGNAFAVGTLTHTNTARRAVICGSTNIVGRRRDPVRGHRLRHGHDVRVQWNGTPGR